MLMLINTLRKIAGYTNVKRAITLTSQDVNSGLFVQWYALKLLDTSLRSE